MEATGSSETAVDFQRTTQRCIPEGKNNAVPVTGRGGP
jgi:hypothetical protein